ncbi:hypothetical protein [Variovorax sp. LT1R16]|uniref:hypothetical protein n=1 Tax=Variovorax sp. LT1R16 TaxID=3443728 RepID=UPI003F4725CE
MQSPSIVSPIAMAACDKTATAFDGLDQQVRLDRRGPLLGHARRHRLWYPSEAATTWSMLKPAVHADAKKPRHAGLLCSGRSARIDHWRRGREANLKHWRGLQAIFPSDAY